MAVESKTLYLEFDASNFISFLWSFKSAELYWDKLEKLKKASKCLITRLQDDFLFLLLTYIKMQILMKVEAGFTRKKIRHFLQDYPQESKQYIVKSSQTEK